MLKRKFFAVALPLVASATIVGSGFAAWVFNDETNPDTKSLGVEMTEKCDLEGVSFKFQFTGEKISGTDIALDPTQLTDVESTDTIKLVLDQGKEAFSNNNETTLEPEKGIHFTLTRNNTTFLIETLEVSLNDTDEAKGKISKIYDAGYEVNINTEFTLDTNLLKYVKIKESTSWCDFGLTADVTNPNVYKATTKIDKNLTFADSSRTTLKFTLASEKDGTSGNFYMNNKMFLYHDTTTGTETIKKPTNTTKYTEFKNSVNSIVNAISIKNSLIIVDAAN